MMCNYENIQKCYLMIYIIITFLIKNINTNNITKVHRNSIYFYYLLLVYLLIAHCFKFSVIIRSSSLYSLSYFSFIFNSRSKRLLRILSVLLWSWSWGKALLFWFAFVFWVCADNSFYFDLDLLLFLVSCESSLLLNFSLNCTSNFLRLDCCINWWLPRLDFGNIASFLTIFICILTYGLLLILAFAALYSSVAEMNCFYTSSGYSSSS